MLSNTSDKQSNLKFLMTARISCDFGMHAANSTPVVVACDGSGCAAASTTQQPAAKTSTLTACCCCQAGEVLFCQRKQHSVFALVRRLDDLSESLPTSDDLFKGLSPRHVIYRQLGAAFSGSPIRSMIAA
jgi:hypothetical protein